MEAEGCAGPVPARGDRNDQRALPDRGRELVTIGQEQGRTLECVGIGPV
jgi:hypothetical protein